MSSPLPPPSPETVSFLAPYLPPSSPSTPQSRPYVTLTYASSLDSMISLSPGRQTHLSGAESKSMTHHLRRHHAAILVGVSTVLADDPGLNCRLPGTDDCQPIPVIVDPHSRWRPTPAARMLANGGAKKPIVLSERRLPEVADERLVEVLEMQGGAPWSWKEILESLWGRGIRSVMVEGGAAVINGLLVESECVDAVVVTVAPVFLGAGGVRVEPERREEGRETMRPEGVEWAVVGKDAVVAGRVAGNVARS